MEARNYATQIVKRIVQEGYVAYFAGGWVRDYLMQHPSSDIDIATNAPPEKILDLFPRTILVGLAFGVVIVVIDGHQFEVSSFRRDITYLNGRKPERVEFSTAYEDALRRDFTINGMFYDPLEEKIIDYVHGTEDIKRGLIRTIGDPQERFMEDRLRMIRAVRFAARFSFQIDPATQRGIIENAETLFPAVAMERIWQEFNKMCHYPRFDHALIEMHRFGLLPIIFPQMQHMHLNDLKKIVAAFPHFPKKTPTILYLAELFPHQTLEELLELCQYLKTSGQNAQLVEFFYRTKLLLASEKATSQTIQPIDWAYLYAHPDCQTVLDVFQACLPLSEKNEFQAFHEAKRYSLAPHIERIKNKQPLVSAKMLQTHGIEPGRLLGSLLKEAEKIAINQNLHHPEIVINLLQQTALWPRK